MCPREPAHVRPRRPRISLPDWAIYVLMSLFVIGVVTAGYYTFNMVKNAVADAPVGLSGGVSDTAAGSDSSSALAGDQGQGASISLGGRVTVLLLGIDERELETGPWRTDTMILLTLDPAAQTAGMLSIPRDLWVEIPDYGVYDRINTAHFRGDADRYPGGGGPALAMKTVQHNFGVPVDYFVSVNFLAFVQIIDRLGCIPVTVPQAIDDPNYPAPSGTGFDPFYLEAGDYCMGGETLLKYARTRATAGSDFDRARRQQQVIYAVRDHVLSTDQLTNLIAQAPEIYNDAKEGIHTNLSLQQMIELAREAADIPDDGICSGIIDNKYVTLTMLNDGSQVLVPDRNQVRGLVLDIFTNAGQCQAEAIDLAAEAATEHATVGIRNGTQHDHLATETGNMLAALGIDVRSVENADRFDYAQTIIYSYSGKDYTARYLAQLLGVPETAIVATSNPNSLYDIEVILGADYRP